MNCMEAINYIGLITKELEEHLGLSYYLETKDDFLLEKSVDEKKLFEAFLVFNKTNKLQVFEIKDGTIHRQLDLSLNRIREELMLLAENEGIFVDRSEDDLATSYLFLAKDYFAEIMKGIIFFSGTQEPTRRFAHVLSQQDIEYHEPELLDAHMPMGAEKTQKLGRNEQCHCGSHKKYKKCCLDKDLAETGKAKKVIVEK